MTGKHEFVDDVTEAALERQREILAPTVEKLGKLSTALSELAEERRFQATHVPDEGAQPTLFENLGE